LFASPSFYPPGRGRPLSGISISAGHAQPAAAGFRSTVSAKAGRRVEDHRRRCVCAAALPNVNPSVTVRRQVLAQLSRDTTDEHFPLLIFEGRFRRFTLTTRFKT